VEPQPLPADGLRAPDAGARVIRGGAVRAAGYGLSVLLAAASSVLLLRYLGVEDFALYATVTALLGVVTSLTEGGLSIVGARDLAVRAPGEPRRELLGNLVTLRVALTAAGVAAAAVFAVAVGYEDVVVAGTLLAGLGVLLLNLQVTMSLPLRVELRMGAVTGVEVLNQAATCLLVAALVVAGAPLAAFFGVQVAVGALAVAVTVALVGAATLRPRASRAVLGPLVRAATPLAAAVAMNVVYPSLLVLMVSLLSTETQTGLFGTSYRVFQMLVGLPTLVLGIALPVLAVHVTEERSRFRYGFQRLTEVALVAGAFQAVAVAALAEPAVVLLYGDEYRQAGPLLAVQGLALVPLYLAHAWTLGLVALHRQRGVAAANLVALGVVLAAGTTLTAWRGADGAATAAVVTEAALALGLLALLVRRERDVAPGLAFAWRPAVAALAGAAPLLLAVSPWVEGVLAVVAFAAVALAVRAVPAEVLAALRRGRAA
jgi:O-antigen/teichoic acid export membrane protein